MIYRLIRMKELIAHHRATWTRADWFADDAMRFFGTRLPEHAHQAGPLTFFVTRETGPGGATGYAIRSYDWETGEVDSVSALLAYPTEPAANRAMRQLLGATGD